MSDISNPQPGFYLMRLVRGGPLVAAKIEYGPSNEPDNNEVLERSWYWRAIINGTLAADPSPDPVKAGVFRIWPGAQKTTENEYNYKLAVAKHAETYTPNAPEANPHEKIDKNKTPILF